eukprot:134382-Pleurochrysis_carterae.AAC.3
MSAAVPRLVRRHQDAKITLAGGRLAGVLQGDQLGLEGLVLATCSARVVTELAAVIRPDFIANRLMRSDRALLNSRVAVACLAGDLERRKRSYTSSGVGTRCIASDGQPKTALSMAGPPAKSPVK